MRHFRLVKKHQIYRDHHGFRHVCQDFSLRSILWNWVVLGCFVLIPNEKRKGTGKLPPISWLKDAWWIINMMIFLHPQLFMQVTEIRSFHDVISRRRHLKSPARSHHVVVITDPRQCCSSKSYQTHASHSLLLGSLQADNLFNQFLNSYFLMETLIFIFHSYMWVFPKNRGVYPKMDGLL